MKIYLDLIFLINYAYDFLILLSVSILLKRIVSLKRIFIASLIGSLSIITLFVSLDGIFLLLLKLVLSFIMVLVTFGKSGYFTNLFYFYIITIILGGSTYLIDGDNTTVNIILMFLIGPIIVFLYILNNKKIKLELSTIYDVILIDSDNTIKLRGMLDTGNNIKCPITNLPVIMVSNSLKFREDNLFLVPYQTIDNQGLLHCYRIDGVVINGRQVKCLISKTSNIDKNEVLLNNLMRETIEWKD